MSNSKPLPCVSNKTLIEIATTYDTPVYVYDHQHITDCFRDYQQAFSGRKHQVCYAVKANANLAILKLLADLGAGFDIVSVGELQRVLMAGGAANKTIFSGVGKRVDEIAFALEVGIAAFDVESLQELECIISVAKTMTKVAPVSIRFNPNVDAKTHPYISTGLKESKFGLTIEQAITAYQLAKDSPFIEIVGINMHIGSQITEVSVFVEAMKIQANFVKRLKKELGIHLKHINLGGGIGVKYDQELPIKMSEWAQQVKEIFSDEEATLLMEPGRSIVANAGVLLTRVLYTKEQSGNHFTVVDAAMNDYARVALYQAYNQISNLSNSGQQEAIVQSVVGPVCESADCFAKDRQLSAHVGDLLAIHDTGAYGFVMASNYNTRGRPAEVLADGKDYRLIRQRETFEDLIAPELVGEFELETDFLS